MPISDWTIRKEALDQAVRHSLERGGDVLDTAEKYRAFLAGEADEKTNEKADDKEYVDEDEWIDKDDLDEILTDIGRKGADIYNGFISGFLKAKANVVNEILRQAREDMETMRDRDV